MSVCELCMNSVLHRPVALSSRISVEFSANSTLASSKCLSDMCDAFLIVMQHQYALAFTNGKMVVAHLLCQWLCANSHFIALVCLDGLPFSSKDPRASRVMSFWAVISKQNSRSELTSRPC
jgi:hypothetical protein